MFITSLSTFSISRIGSQIRYAKPVSDSIYFRRIDTLFFNAPSKERHTVRLRCSTRHLNTTETTLRPLIQGLKTSRVVDVETARDLPTDHPKTGKQPKTLASSASVFGRVTIAFSLSPRDPLDAVATVDSAQPIGTSPPQGVRCFWKNLDIAGIVSLPFCVITLCVPSS